MGRGKKTIKDSHSFRLKFSTKQFTASHTDSRPDILADRIQTMGLTVVFLWVPAHVTIRGNEMAGRVAKEVAKRSSIDLNISISKPEVKGK